MAAMSIAAVAWARLVHHVALLHVRRVPASSRRYHRPGSAPSGSSALSGPGLGVGLGQVGRPRRRRPGELDRLDPGQNGVVVRLPGGGERVLVQFADHEFGRFELAGRAGRLGRLTLDQQIRVVLRDRDLELRFGASSNSSFFSSFLSCWSRDGLRCQARRRGRKREQGQPERAGSVGREKHRSAPRKTVGNL